MALMSPDSSAPLSPPHQQSPVHSPRTALAPLVTPSARTPMSSSASTKKRFSTFSVQSNSSLTQIGPIGSSRPQSMAFPHFHSTLTYALVRDFAYPPFHPMHYGPAPESSKASTPISEAHHRRGSDPAHPARAETSKTAEWSPFVERRDGPPYPQDDDLHSPVVTTSRHRKKHDDGSTRHSKRVSRQNGGDIRHSTDYTESSHPSETLPSKTYNDHPESSPTHDQNSEEDEDEEDDDDDSDDNIRDVTNQQGWDPYADDSRWSRDYQFTIVSPDEEMHGRAVALFDFERENENELPLVEGQIVLISYRHGEGWLVAQDPRTQESGLVPEEYVRLLRDIEGGYHGLMNGGTNPTPETDEIKTPTQESTTGLEQPEQQQGQNHGQNHGHTRTGSGTTGEYYQPVVSTFSTSREDFEPWPAHKLTSPTSEQHPVRPGSVGKGKDAA